MRGGRESGRTGKGAKFLDRLKSKRWARGRAGTEKTGRKRKLGRFGDFGRGRPTAGGKGSHTPGIWESAGIPQERRKNLGTTHEQAQSPLRGGAPIVAYSPGQRQKIAKMSGEKGGGGELWIEDLRFIEAVQGGGDERGRGVWAGELKNAAFTRRRGVGSFSIGPGKMQGTRKTYFIIVREREWDGDLLGIE